MKSYLIYRASFYVMLTVSVLILCGDTTDSRLNWLLPMVTVAAGGIAFLAAPTGPGGSPLNNLRRRRAGLVRIWGARGSLKTENTNTI